MSVSNQLRETILSDFQFALDSMQEAERIDDLLYYYSGFHGVLNRVINIEFDPGLLFLHDILNASYQTLLRRVHSDPTATVRIENEIINALLLNLQSLVVRVENDTDYFDILQNIANLSYITTGNGYFLYKKGVIVPSKLHPKS